MFEAICFTIKGQKAERKKAIYMTQLQTMRQEIKEEKMSKLSI